MELGGDRRGEEAGPSGLVTQTRSTSRQKGHALRVEPWDADSDSSDDVLIHVPEDESSAEELISRQNPSVLLLSPYLL